MNPKCGDIPSDQVPSDTSSNSYKTFTELQSRLNHLNQLLTKPQILHLHGFEKLLLKSVSHSIKHQVNTLFFEAHIPINWTIRTKWSHLSENQIVVHLTLLNYIVKERVKELLVDFLKNDYNNIIYDD